METAHLDLAKGDHDGLIEIKITVGVVAGRCSGRKFGSEFFVHISGSNKPITVN